MALALENAQSKSASALNLANFSVANAAVAGVSAAQKTQSSAADSVDVAAAKEWYAAKNYTKACIKNIQRAVGFTEDSDIDGIVGTKTIKKVASWQESKGLTVDGEFGAASAQKAGITLESNASSQDSSSSTSESSLDIDSIKEWYSNKNYTTDCIKNIQRAVGFTASKDIDGVVGSKTIKKVAKWQEANGLTADGEFGSASAAKAGITLETKSSSDGSKTDGGTQKTPDPEPVTEEPPSGGNDAGGGGNSDSGSYTPSNPSAIDTSSLDDGTTKVWYAVEGYTKSTIKAIQKKVGFTDSNDIDGCVGPKTIQKVKDWQKANGLTANGRFDANCAQNAGISLERHSMDEYHGLNERSEKARRELLGFSPLTTWENQARNDEDKAKIDKQVTSVSFPIHDENGKNSSKSLTIHKKLAANVRAVFTDIYTKMPTFRVVNVGGYEYRKINGKNKDSKTLSNHSFAAAFDINYGADDGFDLVTDNSKVVNSKLNPFYTEGKAFTDKSMDTEYRMRTKEHPVVKACDAHGFGWGGEYGDYMHFSYFGGH